MIEDPLAAFEKLLKEKKNVTGHEKNGDRFCGQGVALGLEHIDPNHHGSGVDHAVDLLPEGN